MVHPFTTLEPFQDFWLFTQPLGWNQHGDRLADGLLRRVAKETFRAFVPTSDDAV